MSEYIQYPAASSGGGGVAIYSTFSAFPSASSAGAGALAVAQDTGTLYESNGTAWLAIAAFGDALSLGALDLVTQTSSGASLASNILSMQSATASFPGLVNTSTQAFGGIKNFKSDLYVGTYPLTTSSAYVRLTIAGAPGPSSGVEFYDGNGGNQLYDLYGDGGIGLSIYDRARASGLAHFYTTETQFINTSTGTPYFTATSSSTTVPALIAANLSANTAVYADGSSELQSSSTTATELGYVHGVTSAIQTQLNGKQASLSFTTVTEATSSVLTLSNWSNATVGSVAPTIQVKQSSGSQAGYLSSADWTTFNGKIGGSLSTVGAVPYVSASGTLSQDASNFWWDSSTHRLGIGNNAPQFPLDIQFASNSQAIQITNTNATQSGSGGGILALAANPGSSTAMTANNRLGFINFQGQDGTTNIVKGAGIQSFATGTWSSSSTPGNIAFYTNAVGAHNSLSLVLTLDSSQNATFVNTVSAATLHLTNPLGTAYGGTGVTSVTTSPTASAFAGWDTNSNLSANNFLAAGASTATAAGTTTLTVSSAEQQFFTGTTTQTVQMPVTSTLALYQSWSITNNSTGVITIVSSGSNTILALPAGMGAIVTCISTSGTTAASWNAVQLVSSTGTVASLSVPNVDGRVAFTPTITGFGTCTSVSFYSWRNGDSLHVEGTFTCGTPTAVTAKISFGYNGTDQNVTSVSTIPSGGDFGGGMIGGPPGSTYFNTATVVRLPSVSYIELSANNSTNNFSASNGNIFASSANAFSVKFSVPISGWSATSTQNIVSGRTLLVPTISEATASGTGTGGFGNSQTGWLFTISSGNATVGATYTNNSNTYTVQSTVSGSTYVWMSGTGATSGSTLTKASGTGDSTLTFSAKVASYTYTPPANVFYLKTRFIGGGGGGDAGGTASSGVTAGTVTSFGDAYGNGGAAGSRGGNGGGGGSASKGATFSGTAVTGGAGTGGGLEQASTAQNYIVGGTGAASPWGGQGGGAGFSQNAIAGVANTGAGGGGGEGNGSVAGNVSGGAGGGAGGYADLLIGPVAASYPYVVGTGGAAGVSGANGTNGAAGGTGYIEITEYYQ